MDIPDAKSIMLPFLQYLDDSQEHHRKDIIDALTVNPFSLTPEQIAEATSAGVPAFGYRCDWARYYLKKSGLVKMPKLGYSKITDRGLAFLEDWNNDPEEIENAVRMPPARFYDYVNNRWPIEDENDNDQISGNSEVLMDFIEGIKNLSTKIENDKNFIKNEAMTKAAFVTPFITLLGYDVSDPIEVEHEYTADIGTKQGEKVDYAILKDGQVIMLIECKKYGTDLSAHTSQLFRYFTAVDHARVAVLTDGNLYQFYTDLEKSNIMDNKPFLEFNMLNIQVPLVNELERFTKPTFDLNAIHIAASDLKYTKKIKQTFADQLEAPDEEFVQFFLSSVYTGERTPAKIQQFTGIVKRSLNEFLDEQINERVPLVIYEEEITEEYTTNQELSETQQRQIRYWTGLRDYIVEKGSSVNFPSPRPSRYLDMAVGRTGFGIEIREAPTRNQIGIWLYVCGDNTEEHFRLLEKQQEDIHHELGETLEWHELPDNERSRICLNKRDTNPLDESDWPHQYEWFVTHLELFNKVFRERIQELDATDWIPEDDAP